MVNTNTSELVCAGLGGMLIGIASTMNLALYGRITGNSGIFGTLIKLKHKDGLKWKFSFLAGMAGVTSFIYHITDDGKWENDSFTITFFDPIDIAISGLHIVGWVIAGLLVGLGTKIGNGCTSGHGV